MASILFGVTVSATANAFLKPQFKSMVDDGWDVHLGCDLGTDSTGLESVKGLRLHAIAMRREPSPLRDLRSLIEWHRVIRQVRPTIIVGSTPKAALLCILASRINRVPVRIYHVRGFRSEGLKGIQRAISLLAERLTIALSTNILLDSTSLRDAMVAANCLKRDQGEVLGLGSCCGVDTDYFRPPSVHEREAARRRIGLSEKDRIVGFVGRMASDKGVNELIEAMTVVNERDRGVKLLLVGPDEGGIPNFDQVVNSENVRYIGPTEDVRTSYWAMDAFALPSYREGFPIAPLEAQACGLPLISTFATGCIDSQTPGNFELMVPPRDIEALSSRISFVINSPSESRRMGAQARDWVVRNFKSSDVIYRQINFLRVRGQEHQAAIQNNRQS